MKSLKSPCSSQNPMGWWPSMTMLKVWHWRSNMLSKQTWVTWLKRFVSYQDWLCTPRPEVNPFSDPTWVFKHTLGLHLGLLMGCPLGSTFCIRTWQQTNRLMFDIIYIYIHIYLYLYIYFYLLIYLINFLFIYLFIFLHIISYDIILYYIILYYIILY